MTNRNLAFALEGHVTLAAADEAPLSSVEVHPLADDPKPRFVGGQRQHDQVRIHAFAGEE